MWYRLMRQRMTLAVKIIYIRFTNVMIQILLIAQLKLHLLLWTN